MIRSELISRLADKHPHLTSSDVEFVVRAVIDGIGSYSWISNSTFNAAIVQRINDS